MHSISSQPPSTWVNSSCLPDTKVSGLLPKINLNTPILETTTGIAVNLNSPKKGLSHYYHPRIFLTFTFFSYDYDHQSISSLSRLFLNNVFYMFLKQAKR